jgi:predicted metal-dependent peptidase
MPKFYLPSLCSEGAGVIACARDTSGSVSENDLLVFATEMNYIKQLLNPELMWVVDFDTKIHTIFVLDECTPIDLLKCTGRGGTDLQPVFTHFKANKPEVLIIFSDLECNEIADDPGYPVIWIRTPGYGFTPKFGKLIEFNPNE